MKVNLKKLGAIVAGATILASSVAFGGVMYSNTELVNDNGAPTAKVVVGAGAAASDGVAAANVAAALAAETYKTQTLTAQVAGEAACGAGEEGESSTCAIASGSSVRLDITVPGGTTEGSADVKTMIGDYWNRELDDRNRGQTDYSWGTSDLQGTNANPFTNANSTSLHSEDLDEQNLYKVTGDDFTPMEDKTIEDPEAAGKTYEEVQNVWISGFNRYSESKDDVIGDIDIIAYTMKFSSPTEEFGIPVCTTPTNTTLYDYCIGTGGNTDYATENHEVKIWFLGEEWVITDMNPPSGGLGTEQVVVRGGSIKIGKESIGGIVNQGEWLEVDDCKYVLSDIEADTHEAAIDVVDANGAVIDKVAISEGTTRELSNDCGDTTIRVTHTVPGYTFGAKWAKMLVLSQELDLTDNQDVDADKGNNDEWKAVIAWKNKGGASGENEPDHLRSVIIYTTDLQDFIDEELSPGDSVDMIEDPTNWKLSYSGLDITNDDRDNLKFTLERQTNRNNLQVRNTSSGTNVRCNVTAPYVRVTSGTSTAFRMTGLGLSTDEGTGDTIYVGTNNVTCTGDPLELNNFPAGTALITSGTSSTAKDTWILRNMTSDISVYGAGNHIYYANNISYELAGDGTTTWAGGGLLVIAHPDAFNGTYFAGVDFNGNTSGGENVSMYFAISEKAGEGVSNADVDRMIFGLQNASASSSWSFNFDLNTNITDTLDKDKVRYLYAGPAANTGTANVEEGTVSERGSVFVTMEDTKVEFQIANDVARSVFTLATVEAEETPAGTISKVLEEGESYTTSNDVTIKVDSIDCEAVAAGSAGTGTSPACVVDDSGLSAVIMPQNEASVEAAIPYTGSVANMVVLDTEAANVGTLITIGGPVVNTVTAELLEGSDVADPSTWPESKLVREMAPGKIVCAGLNAEDTLEACSDLVAQLQRQ